jgi:hypothetical protein
MTEKTINPKLTALFDIRAQLNNLENEKQALKDTVLTPEIKAKIQAYTDALITPEIKQKLADIDVEYANKGEAARKNAAILEDEIRKDTLAAGKTLWAEDLKHRCEFVAGKEKVDIAGLRGFAKAVPEVLAFITTEKPTTRIV